MSVQSTLVSLRKFDINWCRSPSYRRVIVLKQSHVGICKGITFLRVPASINQKDARTGGRVQSAVFTLGPRRHSFAHLAQAQGRYQKIHYALDYEEGEDVEHEDNHRLKLCFSGWACLLGHLI